MAVKAWLLMEALALLVVVLWIRANIKAVRGCAR